MYHSLLFTALTSLLESTSGYSKSILCLCTIIVTTAVAAVESQGKTMTMLPGNVE